MLRNVNTASVVTSAAKQIAVTAGSNPNEVIYTVPQGKKAIGAIVANGDGNSPFMHINGIKLNVGFAGAYATGFAMEVTLLEGTVLQGYYCSFVGVENDL